MKRSLFFFIALTSLVFSCTKEAKPVFTLSGRIYTECGGVPVKNLEIFFKQALQGAIIGTSSGGIVASTTTDSLGYFNITFTGENSSNIAIMQKAGFGYESLIEGVPQNAQNLIIYQIPTTMVKVILKVINAYSASDTLTIISLGNYSQNIKITGPFRDGTLYIKSDFEIGNYYFDTSIERENISYRINQMEYKRADFKTYPCDTSSVLVKIE